MTALIDAQSLTRLRRSPAAFAPVLGCLVVGWIVCRSALGSDVLFLRHAPWLGIVLVAATVAAILWRPRTGDLLFGGWWLLSASSTIWSASPGETVSTAAWHLLYLAAFTLGRSEARSYLLLFGAASTIIIGQGAYELWVMGNDFLVGVWGNKNVQGSQFLLAVPLLAHATFRFRRTAPCFGLALGICLVLSALTRSAAAQMLLASAMLVMFLRAAPGWRRANARLRGSVPIAIMVGAVLAWTVIQPSGIQLFGIGIGASGGSELAKSNTVSSLSARLFMIEDTVRRGIELLPLGGGAGTVSSTISSFQSHRGAESVDVHNYYVQTFMTLGPAGLTLFSLGILLALKSAWRSGHEGLFASLFLFAGYLAFDIPAYYPALMTLFFGLMGVAVASGPTRPKGERVRDAAEGRARSWRAGVRLGVAALLAAFSGLYAYWTLPCHDLACIDGRKLGDREAVMEVARSASPADRLALAEIAVSWNPDSLWAYRYRAERYEEAGRWDEALALRRQIASEFPAADIEVYSEWADAAIHAGDFNEAREAYFASYEEFPHRNRLLGAPY